MPIFEYLCEECGHEFSELIRSKQEEAELECPKCHEKKFKKLISSFAHITNAQPVSECHGPCGECPIPEHLPAIVAAIKAIERRRELSKLN